MNTYRYIFAIFAVLFALFVVGYFGNYPTIARGSASLLLGWGAGTVVMVVLRIRRVGWSR